APRGRRDRDRPATAVPGTSARAAERRRSQSPLATPRGGLPGSAPRGLDGRAGLPGRRGGADAVRAKWGGRIGSGGDLLRDGLVGRDGRLGLAIGDLLRGGLEPIGRGLRRIVLLAPAGQHLDRVGHDLGLPVTGALLVVPGPRLETTL